MKTILTLLLTTIALLLTSCEVIIDSNSPAATYIRPAVGITAYNPYYTTYPRVYYSYGFSRSYSPYYYRPYNYRPVPHFYRPYNYRHIPTYNIHSNSYRPSPHHRK